MKRTLITNIKSLVQVEDTAREAVCGKDMAEVKTIENAYLLIEDDKIADFGTMDTLSENADMTIDTKQRKILP